MPKNSASPSVRHSSASVRSVRSLVRTPPSATQSFVKVSHGTNAVEMADRGVSIPTACGALLADDEHASYRQVHGIDADGRTYAFSGDDCVDWYGHLEKNDHTVAGNIRSQTVMSSMRSARRSRTPAAGSQRLMTALERAKGPAATNVGRWRGPCSSTRRSRILPQPPNRQLGRPRRRPPGRLRTGERDRTRPLGLNRRNAREYPEEILDFGLKY